MTADPRLCGKMDKNGQPCTKPYNHTSKHANAFCPQCGDNAARSPVSSNGLRRDRRCTECRVAHTRYRKYNLNRDEVRDMKTKQLGLCLWCLQPMGSKFAVDHDHKTGIVRGLMHIRCNTEAGFVEKWLSYSENDRQRMGSIFERPIIIKALVCV